MSARGFGGWPGPLGSSEIAAALRDAEVRTRAPSAQQQQQQPGATVWGMAWMQKRRHGG